MTLFQIEELTSYWAQHPPLHLLAASYLGLGKSNNSAMASKLTEPKQRPSSDVSSMLARLGSGFTAGDVHAGLSPVILDFTELWLAVVPDKRSERIG